MGYPNVLDKKMALQGCSEMPDSNVQGTGFVLKIIIKRGVKKCPLQVLSSSCQCLLQGSGSQVREVSESPAGTVKTPLLGSNPRTSMGFENVYF